MAQPHDDPAALANPSTYTWRPLGILSIYRMVIVASVTLLFLGTRGTPFMATERPELFLVTCVVYFALSVVFYLLVRLRQPPFPFQVYSQLSLDVAAITVLIVSGGTLGNGLGALMVVAIAGGSMLVPLRMAALFAAIASLLLLGSQFAAELNETQRSLGFSQVGFLGITVFITALLSSLLAKRARQNQALADKRGEDVQRLEALSTHIVQRLQSGVVALGSDGRVRLINTAAWELLGRPAQAQGVMLRALAPPLDEAVRAWRHDAKAAANQASLNNREISLRFRGLGADGDQGALIFMEDLAALRAQVQQAKLASLGRLSASVAHEIRNPLSAMLHAAQLLQESEEISGADRRLIEIIRNQGARLNRVVESVLTLSRRQAAQPASIALGPWLDAFAEDFHAQFPQARPFTLTTEATPADLTARFDPTHLHQVLTNLCRNALDHGGKAGLRLEIVASGAAGRVTIDVADDGKGIDAVTAKSLFEPFFTTAATGTGLGLYLCRELCESNGAHLELAPSEHGARFRITTTDVTQEVTFA